MDSAGEWKTADEREEGSGGVNEPTYTIAADGQSITCSICGLTSYNANDVRYRFCSRCKIFLDDTDQVQRLRGANQATLEGKSQMANGQGRAM